MDQAVFLRELFRGLDRPVEVAHAQDGDTAIHLLSTRRFDLVVTDLNLPGRDGFEVIGHVQSSRPGLPVLAITADTDDHYAEAAFRAGAYAVLLKPLERETLLEKVRELLPELDEDGEGSDTVLAFGAWPGDVEVGCGGTLAAHASRGDRVLVLHLSSRLGPGAPALPEQAADSADALGVRLFLAEDALVTGAAAGARPTAETAGAPEAWEGDVADEVRALVRRAIETVRPTLVFLPSPFDREPRRTFAHRVVMDALAGGSSTALAYPTATTSASFEPDHFVDIAAHLTRKGASVEAYAGVAAGREELSADFVASTAHRWGSRSGVGEMVEPFLVLRSPDGELGSG